MTEMPDNAPLASPAWLAAHLAAPDVVVLDATLYLPNEGRRTRGRNSGRAHSGRPVLRHQRDRRRRHRPAAHGRRRRHVSPSCVGALGVGNERVCVFYDQRGIFSAARGWWMMGLFGHDAAVVLDGGLPAWRPKGARFQAGDPAPACRKIPRRLPPARLRGVGEMLANRESRRRTGARRPRRRRGSRRGAGTAARRARGHIPGAETCRSRNCSRPTRTCCRPTSCARGWPRPAPTAAARW